MPFKDSERPLLLKPKEPGCRAPIEFTFDDPALVVSEVTAVASVQEGKDSNPALVIGGTSFVANSATVLVQNGVHGVVYKIKATITLTDGTRHVYTVLLPVVIL
jgi:hypothetical protein